MLERLDVPDHLHRNAREILEIGVEETGNALIELAIQRVGLVSLKHTDVLDVGCGVRFTQTLINRRIPIRSYTGIEVHRPIVDYLRERVEPFDDRFRFIHWDVQNAMYNPGARIRIGDTPSLPVSTSFDLIWLFSVFTHLDEGDAQALLSHIRSVVRPTGSLFFSAFYWSVTRRI